MRVCLAYDCLYPWTVGGAERWYRGLAEELARAGHEVVYLTRVQWDDDSPPLLPGIRVVAVSPSEPLYTEGGRRRIGETLRFGRGVMGHLLRHRNHYDAVHLCSFPFFSVIAARSALVGTGRRVLVDWFEVWTRSYWRDYLGVAGGLVGWAVQRLCVALTREAFVFSRLHERRLLAEGFRGTVTLLAGLYAGPTAPRTSTLASDRPSLVVFAGRHISEKRAAAVPPGVARAAQRIPGLRGVIFGDGPEFEQVQAALAGAPMVTAPGFVTAEEVAEALRSALCMVLPSRREGYGLIVVESCAVGTPAIVVQEPDNAAVELVEEGVNGVVAASAAPEDLADAIVRVHEFGFPLRASTAAWFGANAERLSLASSLERVVAVYGRR